MLCRASSGHRLLYTFHSQAARCIFPSSTKTALFLHEKERPSPSSRFKPTDGVLQSLRSRFTVQTSKFLIAIEEMSSIPLKREEILCRLESTPSKVLENSKTVCAFAQELVENYFPERAVHVLRISHKLGIALAHNQYEQVVYRLATHKYWNLASEVATMAHDHTGRWTTRLLNWVILSHVETQQYALLPEVLELFKRDGITATRKTFHLLVRGHLQNSDLIRARNCLVSMREAGVDMDKSTYLVVLGAYRTLGPNETVEQHAFQALRGLGDDPADTLILNGLLQLRIDDGDADGALRVLKLFRPSPTGGGEEPMSDASLNRVPKTLPDNTTFNILLTFFARRKDGLTNVLHIFDQISAAKLHTDVEAVAALIRAHFNAGKAGDAVAIVADMCKAHKLNVDPDVFKLLGHSEWSVEPSVPQALSVRPSTRVFNELLQGTIPEYGIRAIRGVIRIMLQAGINLDTTTTHIIISHLCSAQHMRPRKLIHILRCLTNLPTDQASLTIHHANAIFRSILRRERDIIRSKSWNASAQRVRFGHCPRFSAEKLSVPGGAFDPTAGISLRTYKRSIEIVFEPILQSLINKRVMSNSVTFALSIRRNALIKKDIDSAGRIFDIMIARGIRPNAYHFSALMEGYALQGEMEAAKEVMTRAIRSRVAPNVVMYTILIAGYGKLGRPDLAVHMFNDMRSAGVEPDFAAIDAVVSAYWFVKQYGTARSVLLDMWCLVAPFPQDLIDVPLHVLIQSFRSLRKGAGVFHSSDSPREKKKRLRVARQMDRIIARMNQWHQVQDSVSWAKEYVDLQPMLQADITGEIKSH